MQMILAIDPGTTESAFVDYHPRTQEPLHYDKVPNEQLVEMLKTFSNPRYTLVIEMVASYGMPVGREVFETCLWCGRFIQAWQPYDWVQCYRRDVKLHLCGQARAKDSNVMQSLYDRYGPGRKAAVGTKKNPGMCYGMKGDMWQALAVAITYAETEKDLNDARTD